jgi:hypothetical protein
MSQFKVNTITNRNGSHGPQVCGITTFRSSGMTLPSGPTEMRGGRGRAVFLRGYVPGVNNTMDYANIATLGDAIDFGDTDGNIVQFAAAGSATRGVISGGNSPAGESYYFTFSSGGGVNDFGNQTFNRRGAGGCNDSTRAVFGGGKGNVSPLNDFTNVIDFFIFSTIGDAINFGDLTVKSRQMAACSSPTRGVFAGGYNPTRINNIEFITFTSTGNAQDFGDLTVARSSFGGGSNATRGLFASGFDSPTNYNIIDYIEIATAGNAIDFGDTLQTGIHNTGTACSQTRALFAGGYLSPSPSSNIISYATISTTGDAADFGDLTVAGSVGNDGATSDVNGGIQ